MRYIKLISLVTMLLFVFVSRSQQDPHYIFYRYNMNLINPAYAGANISEEGANLKVASELGVNFNSQWSGVQGAPETQSFFFSTGAGKNVGVGVSVINDRTFVEDQTSIVADVSYNVRLGSKTNLFLGVKAGANSYNVNVDGLITFGVNSDPSLNNIDGRFRPNVGAGLYLKSEKYFLAFSIPNLLNSEISFMA